MLAIGKMPNSAKNISSGRYNMELSSRPESESKLPVYIDECSTFMRISGGLLQRFVSSPSLKIKFLI
jgi:hypothetical protein